MQVHLGYEASEALHLQGSDAGTGPPVVLVHGWPQASDCWATLRAALLARGCRVVTYDRRGMGSSSRTQLGHDHDTYAEDLHRVMTLRDLHDVLLVGFSSGAGDVVRYLGTYGADRVRKAALISALPPFLLQTADNPTGIDGDTIDRLPARFLADPVWRLAARACQGDAAAPPPSIWRTDFRDDLPRIAVPTLVLHGAADQILPPAATAIPLAAALTDAYLVLIDGASHALLQTHAPAVLAELLAFAC